MRIKVDNVTLDRCIGIAMVQTRFMRSSLKSLLEAAGLKEDLNQELLAAAVEAYSLGYNPDKNFREIRNLVQRRLYRFLKAYGFHRQWDPVTKKQGKGFARREFPFEEVK